LRDDGVFYPTDVRSQSITTVDTTSERLEDIHHGYPEGCVLRASSGTAVCSDQGRSCASISFRLRIGSEIDFNTISCESRAWKIAMEAAIFLSFRGQSFRRFVDEDVKSSRCQDFGRTGVALAVPA
jgi:hypothetical protein